MHAPQLWRAELLGKRCAWYARKYGICIAGALGAISALQTCCHALRHTAAPPELEAVETPWLSASGGLTNPSERWC